MFIVYMKNLHFFNVLKNGLGYLKFFDFQQNFQTKNLIFLQANLLC